MLEQLDSAHEQRKAAHEHLARLEGKTEEEKKIEIRTMQTQMLISVVDGNRKAVESDPTDPVPLSELAKVGSHSPSPASYIVYGYMGVQI